MADELPPKHSPELDFEVWRHFAAMGGTDKNTMVTTVSWLLPIAATAIGYIVTDSQMIGSTPSRLLDPGRLLHPGRMMIVSLLGALVSAVAGYLALLYGGYSNRNWATADEIARSRNWSDLLPETSPKTMTPEHGGKPTRLAQMSWRLARPCLPQTKLAPVFTIYWALALTAWTVHCGFFVWAAYARFLR